MKKYSIICLLLLTLSACQQAIDHMMHSNDEYEQPGCGTGGQTQQFDRNDPQAVSGNQLFKLIAPLVIIR